MATLSAAENFWVDFGVRRSACLSDGYAFERAEADDDPLKEICGRSAQRSALERSAYLGRGLADGEVCSRREAFWQ